MYFSMIPGKALEGTFWASSAYCGAQGASLSCNMCGLGISYADILREQEDTARNLRAMEELVNEIERKLAAETHPRDGERRGLRQSLVRQMHVSGLLQKSRNGQLFEQTDLLLEM